MVDIPTLLGYSAVVLLLIAVLLGAVRPTGRRIAWFAAPFAAGAIGCAFLVHPSAFPGKAGLHLGAFFISLAFAFGWQAVRAFFGHNARWGWLLLPSLAWLAAAFVWFDRLGMEALNATLRIGLVALYTGLPAYQLLREQDPGLPSRRSLGMVFLAASALAVLALPFTVWLPQPLGAAPAETWAVVFFNAQILIEVLLASALMVTMSKERAAQQLYEASIRDPLSNLYNRRFLEDRKAAWQRGDRSTGRSRALIYFDIDHFKRINDRFGHAIGDQVIVLAARVAEDSLRKKDWVFRLGGEEFLCVLPDVDHAGAVEAAERLRAAFEQAARTVGEEPVNATLSAGVAAGISGNPDFDALLAVADDHLYAAKQGGRNRVVG
ncbi:GGDEF domain-containing protein [Stenotrophomonas pennii]|uniref:GGDEF domain-containing protein n=1 Tax=Stenotrophomonas lacuserhaii TaxID=2760084 RepID=UPI0032095D6B